MTTTQHDEEILLIRRRAQAEVEMARRDGAAKAAEAVFAVIDGVDRALRDVGEDDAVAAGMRLLLKDALASAARAGLESDHPMGKRFDPHAHEAIARAPGTPAGVVIEVVGRGWSAFGEMVRPARVIVADGTSPACPHGRPRPDECLACFREARRADEPEARRRAR